MTDYLTPEEAAILLADEGFVIRDAGLLASAVLRPQTTVFGEDAYKTDLDKAAAMLESLARNHSLVDGNKRAAWLLTKVFLLMNGQYLQAATMDGADFVEDVARGALDLDGSEEWLREHCTPIHIVPPGQ